MEIKHHPIFHQFTPWQGECDGTYHIDFLGVRTNPRFYTNIRPVAKGMVRTGYPIPHEQYFEWVALLEAVKRCKDRFVIMELGAGWGTWIVRGAVAARDFLGRPSLLIGVEGEELHFEFMKEHLIENRINPSEHRLYHGVVAETDGWALFPVAKDARVEYGCRILKLQTVSNSSSNPVDGHILIPAFSLKTLLSDLSIVDLLHMDVQGEEYRALAPAIDVVRNKVTALVIGTHSDEIHAQLEVLMKSHGFFSQYSFQRRRAYTTDHGRIEFRDGCQVWFNGKKMDDLGWSKSAGEEKP